jgi:hypothetical protein
MGCLPSINWCRILPPSTVCLNSLLFLPQCIDIRDMISAVEYTTFYNQWAEIGTSHKTNPNHWADVIGWAKNCRGSCYWNVWPPAETCFSGASCYLPSCNAWLAWSLQRQNADVWTDESIDVNHTFNTHTHMNLCVVWLLQCQCRNAIWLHSYNVWEACCSMPFFPSIGVHHSAKGNPWG